ncbi:MAG: glycerol-3-phosphate 1-O-acyltransferase PlsY [Gammaproteobacteria bacterium]
MFIETVFVLLSYLIGSVSSAILICKVLGSVDPRTRGSGNPGATNVLRLYGKKAALATLAGDLLKGLIPFLIGKMLSLPEATLATMGVAVFIGHLYPVFFGFQGGKGVATFIGVLYGIAWPLGTLFMLEWVLIAVVFRISSLSALVAAVSSPFIVHAVTGSVYFLAAVCVMVAFIFWRHRSNIAKLIAGTEGKINVK